MPFPRRSGIVLHPTSLPGRYGIGDLGDEAYRFVDFLAQAGQSYWQVLPLSPTGYGDSPYQGTSAFAGNPMLISPERLVASGYLTPDDLAAAPVFDAGRVDYGAVIAFKTALLDRAYAAFASAPDAERREFEQFCEANAAWLDDFALFTALKDINQLRAWYEWEPGDARRDPETLGRRRRELAEPIARHKWRQWVFFKQWGALKRYANGRGVRIIGDIPIYVALDSADVWANPHLFHFDDQLRPTLVSGVPPDYFSATGQLWGHPLYRWERMAEDGFAWWIARFRQALTQVDVLRIDHFRAFYNYWEIPAGETTAINGRWVAGHGDALFRAVEAALGPGLPIIAEDLGDFDADSRAGLDALMERFGFPGMRILQFAFNKREGDRFFPHNYPRNTVVYTGTHDNDTSVGWFTLSSTEQERRDALRYLGTSGADIAWDLIRTAWASVADTAMTVAQDLLSLGTEARLNLPGTVGPPNWTWRLQAGGLTPQIAARLWDLTEIYQRLPS
ncbi:MAG: 4-alpha-glucanotransferase [Chloroflexota bacterium]